MANSYTSVNIHFVFSTKNRKHLIDRDLQPQLWAYLGGIAKEYKMIPLAIGGTDNHVHLLLAIPAVLSPSKCMQAIKSNSSKWVNEEFRQHRGFSWQMGYSGFSVSPRQIDKVINFINGQEEHHRIKSFEEEYIGFLKDSGIEYNEQYVWG